jgi:hypothetical protein
MKHPDCDTSLVLCPFETTSLMNETLAEEDALPQVATVLEADTAK